MNTTKEPAADAAAVTTKIAAKIAAKQGAAEQAEAKQKTKMKKAKATKEEAPVHIWPGLISGPPPGWALPGRLRPHTAGTSVAPVASRDGLPGRAFVVPCFQ